MRILFSNPTKTQKEQSFFDTFKDTFKTKIGGVDVDDLVRSESPDFIKSKAEFGLEVTTLVLNHPDAEPSLAAIRSAQTKCLQNTKKLAEKEKLVPMEVKVYFRSDYKKIDIEYASQELIEYVKRRLNEIDDTKSWHELETGLKYSKWVSIHLGTTNGRKWLDYHRFDRIHMNGMYVDPIKAIQERINAKQKKIHTYLQKFNECWLLIGVDEITAPEAVAITDNTIKHLFKGSFQRIFFLLNDKSELFELQVTQ